MAAALPACYHGAINRLQCEELLGKKNKDGAFLIRDSETIQGALCLCVYKQRVVYTYRLLRTHTGSYTLLTAGGVQDIFFKSLEDLICHYKKKNQGLAIHLRHSIKRKTALLIRPRLDQRPEQRTDQSPDQRPHQSPDQRPHQSPDQRPHQSPDQRPHQRPDQRRHQRRHQRPDQRRDQRPEQRPVQRPDQSPHQRPDQSPHQRPDQSPHQRPDQRPDKGPDQRLDQESNQRLHQIPDLKPGQRPDQSPALSDPFYENVDDSDDYVEVLPD